jgi:hypothetical protein
MSKRKGYGACLVLSQYLPSQNMGKFKRFDTQLVGCQSFGNTFQNFGKTTFFSLVGSKPNTNLHCLTKIFACPNIGIPMFWLALKLAWQKLASNQPGP